MTETQTGTKFLGSSKVFVTEINAGNGWEPYAEADTTGVSAHQLAMAERRFPELARTKGIRTVRVTTTREEL